MNGLAIKFNATGPPDFDFIAPVTGFDATLQACLINLGTTQGSDRIYIGRGTTLRKDAASGGMVNTTMSANTANFAALATTSFVQSTDSQNDSDPLQSFQLTVVSIIGQAAGLQILASSTNGNTRGVLVPVS